MRPAEPKCRRGKDMERKPRNAFITARKGFCYLTIKSFGRNHGMMRIRNYKIDAEEKRHMRRLRPGRCPFLTGTHSRHGEAEPCPGKKQPSQTQMIKGCTAMGRRHAEGRSPCRQSDNSRHLVVSQTTVGILPSN